MTRREALELIDDWLATGFRRMRGSQHEPLEGPQEEASEEVAGQTEGRERGRQAPGPQAPAEGREPGPQEAGPVVGPVAPAGAAGLVADSHAAEGIVSRLAEIASEVEACRLCELSRGRLRAVPGEGALDPPVLFVGEGPGEEEDKSGRPFVGAAGRYLDKWIAAIELERGRCFIANCVKCRPPQNREPRPEEIASCIPYLERQIAALKPRTICCLGRISAHTLLATEAPLGRLRGRVHERGGIPLVATYHPSAVLRDQSLRAPVWEDLKMLKGLLKRA